jgi:hypothetical protein
MTLILTIGNPRGIYQSSDYMLIDPATGKEYANRAGSKQLRASFKEFQIDLAFTGIAAARRGVTVAATADVLLEAIRAVGHDSALQDVCDALSKAAQEFVRPLWADGVLTIILAVAAIGKPSRVATISNVADWSKRPLKAKTQFSIHVRTIRKSLHLISGYRDCVADSERRELEALAKSTELPPAEVMDRLSKINASAAKRSGGSVSEECWVTSQISTDRDVRSSMQNVGQAGGWVGQSFGGVDMNEFMRKNFRAAPGQEIKLVQAAGVMVGPGGGTPVPPPEGLPRQIAFVGSRVTAKLTSPSGEQCAIVDIDPLECTAVARRNERVRVPFARIKLTGLREGADFTKPLYPWPQLIIPTSLDGVPIPRGWEVSLGYWIEAGNHRVEIPNSSRGIRKIAFLGDDDEFVVVCPVAPAIFSWSTSGGQQETSATLEADLWWRVRLDGTSG